VARGLNGISHHQSAVEISPSQVSRTGCDSYKLIDLGIILVWYLQYYPYKVRFNNLLV